MAMRDLWHRSLVYFGLAEESEDDYYYEDDTMPPVEPEEELEDRYRERPNVRRVAQRRRSRDEFDDIFADDDFEPEPRTTRLRAAERGAENGRTHGASRVHLVTPTSFNDAEEVGAKFKDSVPVIMNLQGSSADLSKRLVDFAAGLAYALDGRMQLIADKTFLLTPRNVELSAEQRARLVEKSFYNQS